MKKIRPQIIRAEVNNLYLDGKNPRLPENINTGDQDKIREFMHKAYGLDELALSIASNGYFEAEPMVVIPFKEIFESGQEDQYEKYITDPNSQYIVVEGNRRLSTIQGFLKNEFKDIALKDEIRDQFDDLPVVVYPNRDDALAFLGVHHLVGVRKWNVYERARFIVNLKRNKKMTLKAIQDTIGDRRNSARKVFACYCLIEIIEEYDGSFKISNAKENFSYLQLATEQGPIKEFIGFPALGEIEDSKDLIPDDKKENLLNLFSWMFGNDSIQGITDSRQITKQLAKVLADPDGIKTLKDSGDLKSAFEFIGGDLAGMVNLASQAQKTLEQINGKLSSLNISKTLEKDKGEDLKHKMDAIQNIVKDIFKKYDD